MDCSFVTIISWHEIHSGNYVEKGGISRNNMDCNKDISFKIEKTKKVKNVVCTKAPDQTTVYNTDGNVAASLEGMILTVYYADGTEEDVAYGESDQVTVPVRFIPDKTGYYFVDVENGSVSSVQKQATQAPKQSRMRGTKTSSDAGDTQYFKENQTYLIYIYTNKKEATVPGK